MGEKRIRSLVKKYRSQYVPGERFTSEFNNRLKRNQRFNEKLDLCDEILMEAESLKLSPHQKDMVHYLVDVFGDDFKMLHGRAKKETIILVFIFYVKKLENSRINLNKYSISKKYDLDDAVFKLVVCRMCDYFVKKLPINLKSTSKYNHDILSRNGGQI